MFGRLTRQSHASRVCCMMDVFLHVPLGQRIVWFFVFHQFLRVRRVVEKVPPVLVLAMVNRVHQ